uniref:Reverse transcriptase/retrotransposon-derived protein RNase H-like domain-containing protein n=1 Tax=Lygus hesperus TaxID=30085 RepID=A0A0K8SIW3_LYGHE
MFSNYRRFIRGFSELACPLNKLTEEKRKFQWDAACQKSFESLKEAMTSTSVLCYPDLQKPFVLDCDASDHAVGAVLSQEDGQGEKVVAYFSRTLSRSEANYCARRRELLAVLRSVQHFHQYLYGAPFTIRTDHASLAWLTSFRNPEGQHAGTKPCKRTSSRLFIAEGNNIYMLMDSHVDPARIIVGIAGRERNGKNNQVFNQHNLNQQEGKAQEEDENIQWVVQRLLEGQAPNQEQFPTLHPRIRQLLARWDSLEVHDGELFHR